MVNLTIEVFQASITSC